MITPCLYPEDWLRQWSTVLATWPKAKPLPRIDVVSVNTEGRRGPQGKFDPRRYAVTLYPDHDIWDALCTLIHELAHAWSPLERAHHGPHWRETYVELFSWLTDLQLDVPGLRARFDSLAPEVRRQLTRRRRGNELLGALCDITFTERLREMAPTIFVQNNDHTIAIVGSRQHKVRTHDQKKSRPGIKTAHPGGGVTRTGGHPDGGSSGIELLGPEHVDPGPRDESGERSEHQGIAARDRR